MARCYTGIALSGAGRRACYEDGPVTSSLNQVREVGRPRDVWMSHGDTVLKPPPGFTSLATTDNCPVAAMADPARKLFAVQIHPAAAHTPQGKTVIRNSLDAAGATADWSMPSFVDSAVESIRRTPRECQRDVLDTYVRSHVREYLRGYELDFFRHGAYHLILWRARRGHGGVVMIAGRRRSAP